MEYLDSTIDTIKDKKILVISFSGMTPHLEASIEISLRLSESNVVSYVHLGKYVSRASLYSTNILKRKFQLPLRVNRAEKYLIKESNQRIKILKTQKIVNSIKKIYQEFDKDNFSSKINNLEELKKLEYKNYNIGIGISSTLITYLSNSNPFPLRESEKKECIEQINSSIKSILFAENILDKDKYDCIVILNGRLSCENAIKQVAYKKQLEVYFHESAFINTRYFFENYMPHNFKERKKEMARMNKEVDPNIITSLGNNFFIRKTKGEGIYEESYTKNHKPCLSLLLNNLINKKRSENKKIISYFTSSDDEYEAIEGSKLRYKDWGSQGIAIRIISEIVKDLGYYMIVRVHPNLTNKHESEKNRWMQHKEFIQKNGFYWIDQDDTNSSYKLIEASDLIITSGSTIGLESIYLGKPSITIAECYYDSIIPDAKLCQCPEKFKELLISKEIFNKTNKNQVNIYGAWAMGYFPEYKHFIPTHKISALYGRMKDGSRIASPGLAQKLIHQTKKLLRK